MKNKRPRIFIVNQIDESHKYGVGKYISEMVLEAQNRKKDYKYIVVTLGVEKIFGLQKIKRKGIIYINIPKPYFIKEHYLQSLSVKYSNAAFCLLFDLFKISKSDIFHFNNNMQYFLIKKIKEYTPATIIYTIHVSLWKVFYNNDIGKFLLEWKNPDCKTNNIINIRAEMENCRMADSVICLSKEMENDVHEIYKINRNKIRNIHNGIGLQSISIDNKKLKVLSDELGINKNEFTLLYVGRINEQKGILDVLKAYNHLKHKMTSTLKLIVVGEGELKEQLEENSKINGNKVVFTGYVAREKIPYYYQLSDAIIFPSYNEQSSYVMLEAMKYKIPMIVTDIDAFKSLKHEKTCLKISMDSKNRINFKSILSNIERLESDLELRENITRRTFNLFLKTYTSELMFKNTYENKLK